MSGAATSDERAAPRRDARAALWLVALIVALTLVAGGIGLCWTDDGEHHASPRTRRPGARATAPHPVHWRPARRRRG